MNAYRNVARAAFIFVLIAGVLFVYGFTNLSKELAFEAQALKTQGTVIELSVTEPYRQAVVQFTTAEGRSATFLDKLFWNHLFMTYRIGEKVQVLYNPSAPEATAVIDGFFQKNIEPWWPVILGAVVLLFGLNLRRSMKKKAKILDEEMAGTRRRDPQAAGKTMNRVMFFTVLTILAIIASLVVAFGLPKN